MELYTGRTVKSTEFDYNYVGLETANDQEGPGFYFSTSINTAFQYAGLDGIVIIADVDTTKFLTKKSKPKLKDIKKLILSAPNLEDTLTNFAEHYNKALNIAINSYVDFDSALHAYQLICYDFYRHNPVQYLEQLIKLGYNGHFGEKFESELGQHVVVYNNKVIKVLDVKSSKGINESKKIINKILLESEEYNELQDNPIDKDVDHHITMGYGLIHEIGDASSKSFPFKIEHKSDVLYKYVFTSDEKVNYKVVFESDRLVDRENEDDWTLAFGDIQGYSFKVDSVINKGEVFKVMATIVNITKDFVRRNKNNINSIVFKGTDDRRDNMYAKYISNMLGNDWTIGKDEHQNFVLSPKERYVYESKKIINQIINKIKRKA